MFKQDKIEQAQDKNLGEWFDTPERKRARSRNWALFITRGMLANMYWLKNVVSPFNYRNLQDVLRDCIYELEQQYPDSPGPKTIRRSSRRN